MISEILLRACDDPKLQLRVVTGQPLDRLNFHFWGQTRDRGINVVLDRASVAQLIAFLQASQPDGET